MRTWESMGELDKTVVRLLLDLEDAERQMEQILATFKSCDNVQEDEAQEEIRRFLAATIWVTSSRQSMGRALDALRGLGESKVCQEAVLRHSLAA